jgi:hypothetical protein
LLAGSSLGVAEASQLSFTLITLDLTLQVKKKIGLFLADSILVARLLCCAFHMRFDNHFESHSTDQ